jgi:predicted amidohydrolase
MYPIAMKLACIQFEPAFLDRDETIRRLDPWLDEAAGAGGVDLVVLPELCNSGYDFGSRDEASSCAERADDGPFLAHLAKRCAELGCEIVTGFCERAGDDLYNSAALVSAGGVEGLYRKLHLFLNERDIFLPGDRGLPVFDRPYGRVGMQVCFDWSFPEPWRVLALAGAEIVAHPANFVLPGKAQAAIPVHAMLNRIFVANANRVGSEGDLVFTGRSLIAGVDGEVLAEASQTEPGVVSAEIDPTAARNKAVTARNDALADRRPREYAALCAER